MSAYATRDGRLVQLMLLDPQPYWPGLCKLIGREEIATDPLFIDNPARTRNCDALSAIIAAAIIERDWTDWQPVFEAWDAPWELIRSIPEVHEDPQVIANEMIQTMQVEEHAIKIVAGPVAYDGATHSVAPRQAPALGQHTDDLLATAGYSTDAIAALKSEGSAQ